MDIQAYRDDLKLRLTGYVTDLELNDAALDGCINSAFRQVQRYIDSTKIATIPYSRVINLENCGVDSVSRVFRTQGYLGGNGGSGINGGTYDPMYLSAWQMMSGTSTSDMKNWAENIGAFNTAMQLRNTLSTDLTFRFDKHTHNLYINCPFDNPTHITIEYVPEYMSVDEIKSNFWIDILSRLSLAIAKQVLGRIRKKYTQSNALWSLDVDILQEGLEEEKEIREQMRLASQLCYPID